MAWHPRKKRKGPVSPLGKEVAAVLRRLGADQPGLHPEIWARWGDIVGPLLGKHTFPRYLKEGTLHVAVASSTWMHELSFLKETMIDKLAEAVGPEVVREIRLVLDTALNKPPVMAERPPLAEPVALTSCLPAEIEAAVARITDEALRETVLRAARANFRD